MAVTPSFGTPTEVSGGTSTPWYKNHTVWLVGAGLVGVVIIYYLYSNNAASGSTSTVTATPSTSGSGTGGNASNILTALDQLSSNESQILAAIQANGATSSTTTGSSTGSSTGTGSSGATGSTTTTSGSTGGATTPAPVVPGNTVLATGNTNGGPAYVTGGPGVSAVELAAFAAQAAQEGPAVQAIPYTPSNVSQANPQQAAAGNATWAADPFNPNNTLATKAAGGG